MIEATMTTAIARKNLDAGVSNVSLKLRFATLCVLMVSVPVVIEEAILVCVVMV